MDKKYIKYYDQNNLPIEGRQEMENFIKESFSYKCYLLGTEINNFKKKIKKVIKHELS
ncbi:MAG: hypothetical protein WC373_04900 [Smithella sp.]|jgi:hypothetical protein